MHNQPMLRDGSLKDKTIIVTGGGSGLGKAMSTYFLSLGANVVICSRKQERLDKAVEEMQAAAAEGAQIIGVACDVRKYEDIENVIAVTIEEFGSFNVLVNNAAGNFISPTERLSHRAFDTIVDIVLRGSYNFTLAAGKYWIDTKSPGTVLNIVTTYAWTGSAYVVPSACAKSGVLALTRSLAVEWAKYGIRMNAIAPGPFPTKGAWDRLFPDELKKSLDLDPLDRIPLKRVGEHQELSNLCAYLVSDFSAYVNGEVVTIDGGEWLKGAGQFTMMEKIPDPLWDMVEKMTRGAK